MYEMFVGDDESSKNQANNEWFDDVSNFETKLAASAFQNFNL